ncbi:hypothetical protein JZU61_04220 [bacterium]|nr:hypothetical protein [bacterium]MBV5348846.1 hypothetical protein [bacterium]
MANKMKFSQKLAEDISALIERGEHTINEVCSLSGITKQTFFRWKKANVTFCSLIERAEERKLENLHVEAKRSLLKLIQGFEEIETSVKTLRLKNGSERRIMVISTKHFSPDLPAIQFVLTNYDPEHWKHRLHRMISTRTKKRNVRFKS